MNRALINICFFGLVSAMYYISFRMYETNTVELGFNYKYQFVAINWIYVFLVATTFAIVGLYLSGLNNYIPFLRDKKEVEKPKRPVRLTRAERRAKEREKAKSDQLR